MKINVTHLGACDCAYKMFKTNPRVHDNEASPINDCFP